jgi:hypothetical protein
MLHASKQMGHSSVSGLRRIADDAGVAGDSGPVASVNVGVAMVGFGVDEGNGVGV